MAAEARPYHHGDLRSALIRAATELLEENGAGELSLRAAARRAGVSTAAPYRHFADRDALVSAVAAIGYRDLMDDLVAACPEPESSDDLAAVAVAYVRFAIRRPGVFRAMFAEPCDPTSPERVAATTAMHDYVAAVVEKAIPTEHPEDMATAVWALVHGLAFLHLDGKFGTDDDECVATRVTGAVRAVMAAQGRS